MNLSRDRIPIALLALRIGVFIVMFMWTLDKFVVPEHSAAVFGGFYGIAGLGPAAVYVVGGRSKVIATAQ
jgi:hypothetical protein